MTLSNAFVIVIDLAEQGVIDPKELPSENRKQNKAIELVQNYFLKAKKTGSIR